MGIPTEVFRHLRYVGPTCRHDALLRAGRPSYPNADQGAADAAEAFADSALEHLRGWFESWRLPSLCPGHHALAADKVFEELSDDAALGPGFRWIDVVLEGERVHAYLLADRGSDGDLRDG